MTPDEAAAAVRKALEDDLDLPDALVTNQHMDALTAAFARALPGVLGAAWDQGWETAAGCYWHKPRNPYTGDLNADVVDYCPEHGGTGTEALCDHEDHPEPEPTPPRPCTCGVPRLGAFALYSHEEHCPQYYPPLTLPEVTAWRGGIQFRNPK